MLIAISLTGWQTNGERAELPRALTPRCLRITTTMMSELAVEGIQLAYCNQLLASMLAEAPPSSSFPHPIRIYISIYPAFSPLPAAALPVLDLNSPTPCACVSRSMQQWPPCAFSLSLLGSIFLD